ncbi:hypothetical protein P8452_67781 [Trifolium repens]|nr:hypothetical protein P8452_67781 [Trifolium repens]
MLQKYLKKFVTIALFGNTLSTPDSGAYFCNGCSRHVFQCIPRFRVKVEAYDGAATCVFVLFILTLVIYLKNHVLIFVGKSKVCNGGSFPVEFDSLIGSKMLFIIDKGFNQSKLPCSE